MLALKLVSVLFVVLCEAKRNLVPQAIMQLVKDEFGKSAAVLEVFYNSETKILDETLKLLSAVRNIKITKVDIGSETDDTDVVDQEPSGTDPDSNFEEESFDALVFRDHSIFLFDTVKNYKKVKIKRMTNSVFSREIQTSDQKFLVYCEDLSKFELEKMINPGSFQSYMIQQNGEISLHAVTLYTERQCKVPQLIEINRFVNSQKIWSKQKFFDPKIKNFHGCELKIFLNPEMPFYDDNDEPQGVLYEMVQNLSTELNFKFSLCHEFARPRCNFLEIDMIFDVLVHPNIYVPISDPIYSTSDVIIVPPGEPYTGWEKLLLPFDRSSWMWLGMSFIFAFLVIFLIRISKSKMLYNNIVGERVTAPALNVVAIFMGIGQLSLPEGNGTRFLFINFVVFCLIMRTAYQGKYFEFLTSDMRRKPIATIDELIAKNFTIYVESSEIYNHENFVLLQG